MIEAMATPLRFVDTALNLTPMHKLVQMVLIGLLLVACGTSAVGLIPYGPPAIIATTAVLIAVCIGANALLARVYGVRSDSQSAVITALILALVVSPALSPAALLGVAVVGIISQASKYVLAVRGRHIFNPVAIALAIGSLSGLFYPSWWVATPALALVTAVGAVAVAYKTRLLNVVGGFVAVAAALVIGRSVLGGVPFTEASVTAFTSWPILFFAGFMLTEPTTLPPRKWQKYAVMLLVAVIFAVPFAIGPFASSPAVALVIGNAVAFAFGQRRAIRLTLKRAGNLTPSIREFVFTPATPLAFAPGQYLDLFIPHAKADVKSSRRSFSITSVPRRGEVTLGVRIGDTPSTFKRALTALQPGDTVVASSVSGDFTLPKDQFTKLLFVAGGIGITPFISQLRSLNTANDERDIILLYFVRSQDDVAYADDVARAGGHVFTDGELLTADLLARIVPDLPERTAYVSGPPAMVTASRRTLKKAGAHNVRTDYFSGY